jgi:hypothetical protein
MEERQEYKIGDLVVVAYDCWIHSIEGSELVREGELAIIIQRRDQLMYKPIQIFTNNGSVGWIYSSNIKVLESKT